MRYRLRTLLLLTILGPPSLATGCSLIPTGCSLIPVIPPTAITLTEMTGTAVRLHMYMLEHRNCPSALSMLPKREGYEDRVTDGWGRDLIYSVSEDGIISLTSLGRDGKEGGQGDDADVTRCYRTRNKDGSLNIDDEMWTVHAAIHDENGKR